MKTSDRLVAVPPRQKRTKRPVGFLTICTLPPLLLTIYFVLTPTVQAFVQSFSNATILGMGRVRFVGLDNYTYMFGDRSFLQALGNTAKLMLAVPPVTLCLSLLLAFTLTQCKLRDKGIYRTLFFFPSILSLTVVGIIWSFVFHPTMGILNRMLDLLGASALARPWLGDSQTALWCVAVTLVWQAAGYYMVMHIAAMDSVSPEIYEAATIDGANMPRKFFLITLPLIRNILGITYVLSLSGTLGLSYTLVRVMTRGGPNGASNVLLQYIYTMGMENGSFGYAMAITVFVTLLSILLSAGSRLLTNRDAKGEATT